MLLFSRSSMPPPAPLAGGDARVPHAQSTTQQRSAIPADSPTVAEIIAVMQ
jgi:hypothetical protein